MFGRKNLIQPLIQAHFKPMPLDRLSLTERRFPHRVRSDAEILFVLTTNRPEALEAALASRPGRVDQAIEFPLPDEQGRHKLIRLYARGMKLPEDIVQATVKRTEGVSASFIKELMRRSAQFHLERDGSGPLSLPDVEAALDELLFSGGTLNRKLLGGFAGKPGASCRP